MKKLWLILGILATGSNLSYSATVAKSPSDVAKLLSSSTGPTVPYSCQNCDLSDLDLSTTLMDINLGDKSFASSAASPFIQAYAKRNNLLAYHVYSAIPIMYFLQNTSSLDLTGATLENANFSGLNTPNLILDLATGNNFTIDGSFLTISLKHATLNGSTLNISAANVQAQGLTAQGSKISLNLLPTAMQTQLITPPPASGWVGVMYGQVPSKRILDFSGSADLSGSTLSGNFTGAVFNTAALYSVNFTGTKLDQATFNGAGIGGANVTNASFKGADLTGLEQNLVGSGANGVPVNQPLDLRSATGLDQADFTNAIMNGIMLSGTKFGHITASGAHLKHAHLDHADFSCNQSNPQCGSMLFGADLTDADFTGSNLQGADFRESTLNGAIFTGADLTGAALDNANASTAVQANGAFFNTATLTNTAMTGLVCSGANFSGAILSNTKLDSINCPGVNFSNTKLDGTTGTSMTNANCTGYTDTGSPNFSGSTINQMNLQNLIAQNANFNSTTITNTDFTGANLKGASFSDATVSNINLSGVSLVEASFDNMQVTGPITNLTQPYNSSTSTDFSGATLSQYSNLGYWLGDNLNTDTWGSEISRQCGTQSDLAGSQPMCAAFCHMGAFDACHPFEIYGATNYSQNYSSGEKNCDPNQCNAFVYRYQMNDSNWETSTSANASQITGAPSGSLSSKLAPN